MRSLRHSARKFRCSACAWDIRPSAPRSAAASCAHRISCTARCRRSITTGRRFTRTFPIPLLPRATTASSSSGSRAPTVSKYQARPRTASSWACGTQNTPSRACSSIRNPSSRKWARRCSRILLQGLYNGAFFPSQTNRASMPSILDTIIAAKTEEVRRLRRERGQFSGRTGDRRPFVKALRRERRAGYYRGNQESLPQQGRDCAGIRPCGHRTEIPCGRRGGPVGAYGRKILPGIARKPRDRQKRSAASGAAQGFHHRPGPGSPDRRHERRRHAAHRRRAVARPA